MIYRNQENATQKMSRVIEDSADLMSPTDDKTLEPRANRVGEESPMPKGITEHAVNDIEEINISTDAAKTKYTFVPLGDPVMEMGVNMEPQEGAHKAVELNEIDTKEYARNEMTKEHRALLLECEEPNNAYIVNTLND